jgi:transcriptional regulator with XRE-family HTH domain
MTDTDQHLLPQVRSLDWWQKEVTPRLSTNGSIVAATASAIVESNELCGRPLGELLPGLRQLQNGSPADFLKTVRAWNVVTRQSGNTWEEFAGYSAVHLGSWQNAGRKTVKEIVRGTLKAWASLPPAIDADPSAANSSLALPSSPPNKRYEELRNIGSAMYREGAATIGDVVRLGASGEIDGELCQQLFSISLEELLGFSGDVDVAWNELLEFNEQERLIMAGRIFPTQPKRTLDELGRELGITRERVRQVERKIKTQIESRLADGDVCAPVQHAAANVRRTAGTIASDDALTAELTAHVSDNAQDAELRRAVLREMAGPYRLNEGFWQVGNVLEEIRSALDEGRDEPLSEEEIDDVLASVGVVAESRANVLALLPLHWFEERYIVWTGSLQDKACRLLKVHGAPMSRDELHAAMGAEHVNFRSMVNVIGADERIRRVGLDLYGLTAWGGEEYTGIADEIEQAIRRRGGRADLEDVVSELVEWFGVSAQSVRSYAASRRFSRDSDGALVVAPDDAVRPEVARVPPELDRDLVVCGESWTVRVIVDSDVLRGSGRPTRTAIAQAAGVSPAGERKIELGNGAAVIGWRQPQPTIGSLRSLAETLSCDDGDLLFVPLRDRSLAFSVSRYAVQEATGLRRVALELGVFFPDPDLSQVAAAIGLGSAASVADIRTRLRARRQDELVRYLPADSSSDDDQLEELMGLGE